jgi:hypothetical protein
MLLGHGLERLEEIRDKGRKKNRSQASVTPKTGKPSIQKVPLPKPLKKMTSTEYLAYLDKAGV